MMMASSNGGQIQARNRKSLDGPPPAKRPSPRVRPIVLLTRMKVSWM